MKDLIQTETIYRLEIESLYRQNPKLLEILLLEPLKSNYNRCIKRIERNKLEDLKLIELSLNAHDIKHTGIYKRVSTHRYFNDDYIKRLSLNVSKI